MNILYIDHYAGSLSMGMEFRPYYLAKEWMKAGHRVLIVAANYSHLRRNNPEVDRDFQIQTIDGVDFCWIKTGQYSGNGVKRALTLFEFCTKLTLYTAALVKEFHPDAVISSSTYPLDTYPAQKIAKMAHARYVHEAHDLWPLTLIELAGWKESHPFIRLLSFAEKSAFSRSDAVIGLFAGQKQYMLEHGLQSSEKFTHIPNGIVMEDWADPEPLTGEHLSLVEQFKEQEKLIVCYLGGHALSNALDVFLDAAKMMKDEDKFVFLMVGNGVEKPHLQRRAEDEKITNLHFLPPVHKKQVPSLLSKTDVLYVGAEPCTLYRYGVSMNKVYDYMMAAKPIVYGVEAANNDVKEANCGVSIRPGSAEEIRQALIQLQKMSPVERKEMGERGKAWVMEHCDYAKLADCFLHVLKKV